MANLYPAITPYKTEMLKVSDLHTLYIEQCGNPEGIPVAFVHGGPGGGVNEDHRRFFDPKKYRIVLFDQRGSGKSTPAAELKENTTWDLVADMEKIREHLNINTWVIFGGSWGATLALTYAITHPEKVRHLILRGIFLCRPSEIKWFYQFGASEIYPDIWESYSNHIPQNERHDFVTAYYKLLTHENADIRLEAAKIWSKWEAATSKLFIDVNAIQDFDDPTYALQFARIECHYFIHNAFFETENWILENISKIKNIPCDIIQGRYDIVCPIRSAWDLHRAWPESRLNIIQDAGHSAMEKGIIASLIEATDKV
ncbi:MAG: prolyl aminopeptidase [Pseudobdellovibrio sp.]